MSRRRCCFLATAWLLAGCGAPPSRPAAEAPSPSPCQPPAGASGAPRTIGEVTALANALPHPLELTCFLEALARPLAVHAAVSTISLQPAPRPRSPRIFLFTGDVIMSVVPDGLGQPLVEMSQRVAPDRSVKAELRFPVAAPVPADYPFAHVQDGDGTTCRFCHPREAPAPDFGPAAYSSGAFRPLPRARVDVESLRAERATCHPQDEPARCALLAALFDHGEVREQEFPSTVPTAFDH